MASQQQCLRVYRNGVQVGADQVQTLTYSGGSAPFSFTPTITAEFAHYDIELLLRDGSNQLFSVQRAQDIVAGDVIVIQGQSNAAGQDDCRQCERLYQSVYPDCGY